MQKILSFITLTFTLIILSLPIQAQDVVKKSGEIDRARQDFLFQFNKYNDDHKEYLNAKNSFQQFGTISAQQEAIEKTKAALYSRAEALRSYLQLLKVILNERQVLDTTIRNSQFGKLEATQSFLVTHQQNVQNSKSITEINTESERLEREAVAMDNLAYESLSVILIGRMQELVRRCELLLNEVKATGKLPETTEIEQGISAIESKLTSIRVHIDRSNQMLNKYQTSKPRKDDALKAYGEIKKEAVKGKQTLKEAALLIKELFQRTNE